MLKACISVEQCLNLLFDKLRSVKMENQILKSENEKIRRDIISKGNIISVLEREVQIFRDKCEKGSQNDQHCLRKLKNNV